MNEAKREKHTRCVFRLLDDVNKMVVEIEPPLECGPKEEKIEHIIRHHPEVTNNHTTCHGLRLTHYILYLNTELEHCNWIKNEAVFKQYIHGKILPRDVYYTMVEMMKLGLFIRETIMCTPYRFCRDLVEITLNIIKSMDCLSQLTTTRWLLLAMFQNVDQMSVENNLEEPFTNHFNQAMMIFNKDNLPKDVKRLDSDDERKEIEIYNGHRLRSIFKIFLGIIKYNISSKPKIQDVYKSSALFSVPTDSADLFKQYFDIVMYKCTDMCDFSVDTWISWYEVELVDKKINLQSAIGYLCHDLCTFIENGTVNKTFLSDCLPMFRNIALEKVKFNSIDASDIDRMIDCIDSNSTRHMSSLVKTLMENDAVFDYPRAIDKLGSYVKYIDYECFRFIVDRCIRHFKGTGAVFDTPLGGVLFKGIMYQETGDKMSLLKRICVKYSDTDFQPSTDFSKDLDYVIKSEYLNKVDINDLISRLVWLILQQPRKMLNILISQHITGICGLPPKLTNAKKTFIDQALDQMHFKMHVATIIGEYFTWLDFPLKKSCSENLDYLYQWIVHATKNLHLIKPKKFLKHILIPLLCPSSDIIHMLLLVALTKFFFNECDSSTSRNIEVWDRLLIQFARMLDKNRWNMDNFSVQKSQLCENIIMTIQPILDYGIYSGTTDEFDKVKKEVSSMHLMTQAHFMYMWTSEYITINGMEEQFIMTVHSKSHISYSNLNASSTQKAQEEFIFSIATYMPKFTLRETSSFIVNYLSSTNSETIVEASFFLWDCVMSAFMRTIVYLKTNGKTPTSDVNAWDYLDNAIVNFIDASNVIKTNCIYKNEVDTEMKYNSLSKIVMVTRNLYPNYQTTLLIVIRRLIDSFILELSIERSANLLNLISSMDKSLCREYLGDIVVVLTNRLPKAPPSHEPLV